MSEVLEFGSYVLDCYHGLFVQLKTKVVVIPKTMNIACIENNKQSLYPFENQETLLGAHCITSWMSLPILREHSGVESPNKRRSPVTCRICLAQQRSLWHRYCCFSYLLSAASVSARNQGDVLPKQQKGLRAAGIPVDVRTVALQSGNQKGIQYVCQFDGQ